MKTVSLQLVTVDLGNGRRGSRIPVQCSAVFKGNPGAEPMASYEMSLPGAQLEGVERDGDRITLHFSLVYLIRTIEDAWQKTRWKQALEVVIEGVDEPPDPPPVPSVVGGGEVILNIYTYRDLVPLPLDAQGDVGCKLIVEGQEVPYIVHGERITAHRLGDARYIEHILEE